MNRLVFILILISTLAVSLLYIIPTFAPKDQQLIISDWVGTGASALILLYTLVTSRFKDKLILGPISVYVLVFVVTITGVYWWIPKYVPQQKQSDVTRYLFVSTALLIILAEQIYKSIS